MTITLHTAQLDDMEAVFLWRNAPLVRASSFNTREITWTEHEHWFKKIIQQDTPLLIGKRDDQPIGVLRYDVHGHEAEVNIYLAPGFEKQGLGPALLQAGNAWLMKNNPELKRIIAKVLPENIASHKAFKKAGFRDYYQVYQFTPDNP